MDWKNVLSKIAPTVVSALCGPLAGGVLTLAGEIFGIEDATTDKIKRVIESGQLTGEHIFALKELELKLKAEEDERGFRYAELEFKDRDSARARDTALVQAGKRNYRADSMFVLAVAVICWLVWIVWKGMDLNEYVKGIFTLVLGRFLGYLDNIYSFEFGTTRQGQYKTELLARKGDAA